ncbi:MAG: hypothetical protein AAGJ18_21065 [Bacteroidota bacterium]
MAGREMCIPRIPKGRGVGFLSYRWAQGQTVTIGFIGGTTAQHQLVKQGYQIYKDVKINLDFDYLDDYTKADIRVSFLRGATDGSWSEIGTSAKSVSKRQPTMNISLDTLANVLHEIWHSLGGGHEHGSPNSRILWDKEFIELVFASRYGWSKAQIQSQLYNRYTDQNLLVTDYDPESISHYPISSDLTLDNFSVPLNKTLSKGDKITLLRMYPPIGTMTPQETSRATTAEMEELAATIADENSGKIINPKPNYATPIIATALAGLAWYNWGSISKCTSCGK